MQMPCLSYGVGVRLSVYHSLLPYQNDASYDHEIFTVCSEKD